MGTGREASVSGRAGNGRREQDRQALERRRREAAKLFERGVPQAEVARRLRASRQSVSRWFHAWHSGGVHALRRAGRAGRPPRLSKDELRKVERALLKGPRACGFRTELWTLSRVAEVIERVSGVRYHQGHIWKILKAMGWSLQRPAKRAVERDEQAVERWKTERWPKVKKTPAVAARGSSS